MKTRVANLVIILLLSSFQDASSAGDAGNPAMSINDLMVKVITPATDTIWGVDDPQTDAEWQEFVDAANAVMEAAKTIKAGGTGPNDNIWAADPAWDAFADRVIAASAATIDAAGNKDVEAMYLAGEDLYSPCEECHIRFHPDFQQP